jgi:hypothetical protein
VVHRVHQEVLVHQVVQVQVLRVQVV